MFLITNYSTDTPKIKGKTAKEIVTNLNVALDVLISDKKKC